MYKHISVYFTDVYLRKGEFLRAEHVEVQTERQIVEHGQQVGYGQPGQQQVHGRVAHGTSAQHRDVGGVGQYTETADTRGQVTVP